MREAPDIRKRDDRCLRSSEEGYMSFANNGRACAHRSTVGGAW